ncbi:MAG TPA: hypothetical protein ENH84_06375 [Phycisphaerae bacterium]|nr:hypothetical protein [Phycisphaerae bacterium]
MKLLQPQKQYTWYLLVFALCFTGFGIWSLWRFQTVSAWSLIVTSLLLIFFLILSLLPNASYLFLRKDGFRIRHLFTVSDHKWDDVAKFLVGRRLTGQMAVYYLLGGKCMFKVKVFPESYGLDPEELYKLLNLWRNRAVGESEAPSGSPDLEAVEPQFPNQEASLIQEAICLSPAGNPFFP